MSAVEYFSQLFDMTHINGIVSFFVRKKKKKQTLKSFYNSLGN